MTLLTMTALLGTYIHRDCVHLQHAPSHMQLDTIKHFCGSSERSYKETYFVCTYVYHPVLPLLCSVHTSSQVLHLSSLVVWSLANALL